MKPTLLCCALLSAFSSYAQHETHDDEMERIVIIAPMQTPLTINTDPKAPRQPLPAQDGADLLSSIAGFSLIKKGGASSDPVFRGMAGSRLNIIADGGLTLGGCGNRMDPPTAYITPQTYDTLKVIKGPQTVLYGPGNSAATVVFERSSERMDESGIEGFLNGTVGSAERKIINTDIKLGDRTKYARFATSRSEADDYQDGLGNDIHSAYKRWNADAEFAYTPDDDSVYSLTVGRSDAEVAYADRMMDGSKFDRTHAAFRVDLENISESVTQLQANVFYNYVDHIMDNHSLRPFTPTMMMPNPTSSNPDRRSVGAKIMLTSPISEDIEATYGLDYQANTHRNRISRDQFSTPVESLSRVTDAKFSQIGAFAEFEVTLTENAQWVSGLRTDFWGATDERDTLSMMMTNIPNPTAQQERNDTLWSGFTRYQAQSEQTSYYVGLGRTERFPDYWEIMGAGRASAASPSAFLIETEKTTQVDIGFVFEHGNVSASSSAFYNQIDDFLLADNAYQKMGKAARVTRNIDAESYGFEAEAKWNATQSFAITGSINYVRGTNLTDNSALAQQPPLQLRFAANYTLDKWQMGALWRVVQKQHRVAISQGNIAGQDISKSAGFGTFALNVSYQHHSDLLFSVGIDNLFDKHYAEHLSKSGSAVSGFVQIDKIYEPGRTIWANVNWRF